MQETQYNFTSSAEPAIQGMVRSDTRSRVNLLSAAQPRVGVARGGTPQLIIEPEPPLAADEDPRYLLDHSRAGRTVVFSSTPPPTTSTPRGAAAGPMLLVVPRASSREARAPTPEVTFGCEESDSGESTLSVNPVSGLREESSGEAHVPQSFRITWVT